MKILGIDPGYDRCGWAILSVIDKKIEFVDAGILQTKKSDSLSLRLHQIFEGIESLVIAHQPDIAIIEELFFSNNQKSVIAVAQSRGVIIAAITQHSVPIEEYTPLQIKAIVAGTGHADKKAVEKMVRLQLQGIPTGLIDDTLDAVAAAYAYACDHRY